jgi:hypothetical protein
MENNDNLPTPQPPMPPQTDVKLVEVPITDENTSLNVMVSFLSLANKRGAFGLDESAKIWECIRFFQKP